MVGKADGSGSDNETFTGLEAEMGEVQHAINAVHKKAKDARRQKQWETIERAEKHRTEHAKRVQAERTKERERIEKMDFMDLAMHSWEICLLTQSGPGRSRRPLDTPLVLES